MDKNRAIDFIEHSFLSTLLKEEDITDISYNGKDIFYVSNTRGRMKSSIIIEHQIAKDFIRQLANFAERQFSFTCPILDISIGKYRINSMHQSVARINDDGVITFSIRIASSKCRIEENGSFFTAELAHLLKILIDNHQSLVIGGVTSSGKTELQKYLLSKMKENERVVVIDNVLELDASRNDKLDLTCWQVDSNDERVDASMLIRNALRNNPDWLIVAESRGKEMVDVLNSAMTGLPIITTLHSLDCESMPYRMGRMMMKSEQKIDYQEALKDIYYHFHFYIYLSKKVKKRKVERFISTINYVDENGSVYKLYERKGAEHVYYHNLPSFIDIDENEKLVEVFRKENL